MTPETLPALRNDTVIIRLQAACTALAEAKSIQQTKGIADVAAAAEVYARRQKLGEEAVDFAHAVKIEALRKLGELLKDGQENGEIAGRGDRKGSGKEHLADIGIDRKTSMVAKKLADLPTKEFEEVKEGHKTIAAAIAKVDGAKKKTAAPAADEAEVKALRLQVEALTEQKSDLADTARELEDKLTAFEKTDPDDQQKEIMRLQKQVVKLDAEIKRLTVARNDAQAKNNELIREVKRLRKHA